MTLAEILGKQKEAAELRAMVKVAHSRRRLLKGSTVTELARRSSLSRQQTYRALAALEKAGLGGYTGELEGPWAASDLRSPA